jgi:S-adenosylmethionine-diacylglycerol 3-amino-3-carboxypropyl transferase
MADIKERAKFDFIRYANCWEDADVLLEALRVQPGDSCVSIASSGDNSLSLLAGNPRLVVAFDLNPAQLACLELRAAAFRVLEYDELLSFLGVTPGGGRGMIYRGLRGALSPEARNFWDASPDLIDGGIIHAGKFERYFRLFRTRIVPLIHGRRMVDELLREKCEGERKGFYYNRWNNRRWRLLFRIFFGRYAMGRLGRDPEFFKYVEDDVAAGILRRTEHAFSMLTTHDNPYLNFILKGNFTAAALPHYLRKENFAAIKKNIGRLALVKGDLRACREKFPREKFSAFNLSDIFEYMNMNEFRAELGTVSAMAKKGARVAFWNMMVDRLVPGDLPFTVDGRLSERLLLRDKAFFYKRFIAAVTTGGGAKRS